MFSNVTIKTRLIFTITFLSILLIIGGVIGLTSLYFANGTLKDSYQNRLVPMGQLDQVVRMIEHSRLALAESSQDDPAVAAREMDALDKQVGEIDKLWQAYSAISLAPQERALAEALTASYRTFEREGLKPAIEAVRAHDAAKAATLRQRMRELALPVQDGINNLMQFQLDGAKQAFEQNQTIYHYVFLSCSMGILFGVVLAAFIGTRLVRGIAGPLRQAVEVAKGVAAGDLTQRIDVVSNDEMGELMQALSDMNRSLVKIVGEVRSGANAIATASGQIASGNQDLASRTEQQAGSLEQTAASMHQLTSTVKQNADSAFQARQSIESASEVALKGGAVVAKVVETMGSINDSSKRIVDIIAVIDSIAFQTNILALNAAVEAARAGEQGRGFAVVASEVRSLAQRSAGAAKEIKDLIGDSVERVDVGAKLVDEAGSTMSEIVDSVRGASSLMHEIANASREQTAGIEQVNSAISQMDDATQQNSALVEEASAAAGSLQQQAIKLSQIVSVFQLGGKPATALALR